MGNNLSPITGLVERELLAAEYERDGWKAKAREMRDPGYEVSNDEARALRAITAALSLPTPTADREAIARAITAADASFSYSFNLTRLVDGEETHTLTMPGFDPVEFDDRDDGYQLIAERRDRVRADAILALLHPIDDISYAGAEPDGGEK